MDEGYSDFFDAWDTPFVVAEKFLPVTFQDGRGAREVKIRGFDAMLDLYEIEIQSGEFDGQRFEVGSAWVQRHQQS